MTPTQIAFGTACKELGTLVAPLPPSLDGARLLWALGGNESSFGENIIPRLEPYYEHDKNGNMPELMAKFGIAAAMSYGPLQMMFCNAPPEATPEDFADLHTAMQYSVGFLNSQLNRWKPITLTTIGQIWNAGSPTQTPSPGVIRYCADLEKNYAMPISLTPQ